MNSSIQDRYLNFNESKTRLQKEWEKHGRLIVAFDFDNTVYDYHQVGDTFPKVCDLLRKCKEVGFYLIVFSCCTAEKHPFIENYLQTHNIPFDVINQNAPFTPFKEGKIYYNILLDDRAGLGEAYQLLNSIIEEKSI